MLVQCIIDENIIMFDKLLCNHIAMKYLNSRTSSNFFALPVTKVSDVVEKAAILVKARTGRACSEATKRSDLRIVQV